MNLNTRVYASLEIKREVLIFCVSKVINEKMMIVFKREIKDNSFWLNHQDEVKDIAVTAEVLKSLIAEYEKTTDGFKISKISLILPSTKLKIIEKYQETEILNNNYHQTKQVASLNQIYELKNQIKNENFNSEFSVIDTKVINWKVDDKIVRKKEINQTPGYKLGLTAMIYELPIKVFASHEQVILLTGCNTMLVTLNISELYSLIKKDNNLELATIVTNWNENDLEVGYFEKGILKNFKIIQGGINLVISNFARKLKLKIETAQNYIFNLIDFSSPNNLNSEIYQKWDLQQKILKKYSVLELTKILFYEVFVLYQQIQNVAQYSETKYETENYNFGLIQKIPGSEKLLQNNNRFNHEHVYQEFIFGMNQNPNFNPMIGVNKTLEKINDVNQYQTIYTSVGSFTRHPEPEAKTYSTLGKNSQLLLEKPLFLKHEGILVDYQEIKDNQKK